MIIKYIVWFIVGTFLLTLGKYIDTLQTQFSFTFGGGILFYMFYLKYVKDKND
jgi:hypothetical protein